MGRPKGSHNALREKAPGALSKNEQYRRAIMAPDFLEIGNKDPKRAYRWLSKSLLDRNGGYDRRGWEPITEKNHNGECLTTPFGNVSSGTDLRSGDLVLGFMAKEHADFRRELLKNNTETIQSRTEGFRREVSEAGGETHGEVEYQQNGITEQY